EGADLLAHLVAVDVGEHEVEDHAVGGALAHRGHAGQALARRSDLEPLELDRVGEPAHDVGLVLDDQDPPANAHAASTARRSVSAVYQPPTVNSAPARGRLSPATRPPCASAMCLTSDSPIPEPRWFLPRADRAR